ncbi:hypothetical protein B0T24DRAFT_124052 [Lasiosphaeria ovina]|uniref:Uncharacterized protein n=1 Tax=Lasiosphaeria ovina TaxID=92902 RepID=A0AAE0JSQ3_9PEZI|nr:hypothetical protein B0T24DRAFT_124052 [Lasiosphaeria ovina]
MGRSRPTMTRLAVSGQCQAPLAICGRRAKQQPGILSLKMVKTENPDAIKMEDLDDAPTISPSLLASTQSSATPSLEPSRQQQQQGHDQPPRLLPSRQQQHPSQHHRSSRNDGQSQSNPKPPAECSFSAGPIVMQALSLARQSEESERHYQIRAVLDSALSEVMARLWAAPDSYVMRPDEFSLFNFFQSRFDNTDPVIMGARRRYWQFTSA